MTTDDETESRSGRQVKVARLIEAYGLDCIGAELEQYWTTPDSNQRKSLRDLANYFNQRLLEEVLAEAGVNVLEGEVENTYHLLTGEEVSAGDQTRVRRELERNGVDIESLESDFVSYQAIRTYLKQVRSAEQITNEKSRRAKAIDTIQRLRGRLATVAEQRLKSLRSAGKLTLGDFRLVIDLRVICEDCGAQRDVTTLIEQGGCDCDE